MVVIYENYKLLIWDRRFQVCLKKTAGIARVLDTAQVALIAKITVISLLDGIFMTQISAYTVSTVAMDIYFTINATSTYVCMYVM